MTFNKPISKCAECGCDYQWVYCSPDQGNCYTCQFWLDRMNFDSSQSIRVKGNHYYNEGRGPEVPHQCRGFSGRSWRIKFFDGRILETVDLWYQGEIPERFRDRLPDNAEFV